MRKPLEEMLYEFMEGTIAADAEGLLQGSGDVKYHLGFTMVLFHSSMWLIHVWHDLFICDTRARGDAKCLRGSIVVCRRSIVVWRTTEREREREGDKERERERDREREREREKTHPYVPKLYVSSRFHLGMRKWQSEREREREKAHSYMTWLFLEEMSCEFMDRGLLRPMRSSSILLCRRRRDRERERERDRERERSQSYMMWPVHTWYDVFILDMTHPYVPW